MTRSTGVQGITDSDIAEYLANDPGFFERHAELLGSIQLRSPHGNRAVSLQERQMEMLRERIKGLESKLVEMIRHGQENVAIADRLHRWTRLLLLAADPVELPATVTDVLKHEFLIPHIALRLWSLPGAWGERFEAQDIVAPVSDDARSFAESLTTPYCGANQAFEAASWLDDAHVVQSLAIIPLRQGDEVFGLLVLGSPDPTRFSAEMGTEFLMRIGDIASSALSRLRSA